MDYSIQWAEHFNSRKLAPELQSRYEEESRQSLASQADIEQSDSQSFDEYLNNFYAQYNDL